MRIYSNPTRAPVIPGPLAVSPLTPEVLLNVLAIPRPIEIIKRLATRPHATYHRVMLVNVVRHGTPGEHICVAFSPARRDQHAREFTASGVGLNVPDNRRYAGWMEPSPAGTLYPQCWCRLPSMDVDQKNVLSRNERKIGTTSDPPFGYSNSNLRKQKTVYV